MKTARPNSLKFSTLTMISFLLLCTQIYAQDTRKATPASSAAANDSVILLVKGKIKSGENTVYRSTIDVRDTTGNIIATGYSYKGDFTIKVPVANLRQPLTIEVTSKGYRKDFVDNYVWSYGSVVEFDLTRSLYGKPSKPFRVIVCPNF